jgi:hypothetical protein
MRGRDILAGALLVNAVPHTIIGLAGKRGMTPWGGRTPRRLKTSAGLD